MTKEKFDFLYNFITDSDEPPCSTCDYKCPFSDYKDGKYCETNNPKCYKSFKMWLDDEIK